MRQRIYITQHNIDNGERGDPHNCMVATAFHDAGFSIVAVGDVIEFNKEYEVSNHPTIERHIVDWEMEQPVTPFYFDIWLIDGEVVEIGEAFDLEACTDDCAGLVSEIEAFLLGESEMTV